MLGDRINQARAAAGMSLRDLSELAGITAMAISKYERNEMKPSSDVLLRLAKALGVRVEYFFRTAELDLEGMEFRKHPKLPKKDEDRVLADVREQLERWLELEAILPSSWPSAFKVPSNLPSHIDAMDQIEDVAALVRKAWKLGVNPIRDVIEELEAEGIKVIVTKSSADNRFDGLVAVANGHPVVVVAEDWPGDRQRFTLAHELGHLVLKGRLAPTLDEEKACHRFAGAFLVPREQAKLALGESRSWLEPRELHLLKQEWGLSMGGWLYRAQDLKIINASTAGKLWGVFRANGWREREPEPQYPRECVRRFDQLIYRALAEDLVSESKAAELLKINVSALRARRRMECNDEADCH